MNTFLSIVLTMLIFGIIISIHEFGHFIVARLFGITVTEFSLGMGPAIFKKQGKNTLFSIRLLPIGGYCMMNEDIENDDPNAFRQKPIYARIAVILAGAFMNFVLGIIAVIITLCMLGYGTTTVINEFSENANSHSAGLEVGDKIVKVNGVSTYIANDIVYQLTSDKDGIIDFTVKRDGETLQFNGVEFETEYNAQMDSNILMYDFKVMREDINLLNLIPQTFKNALYHGRIVIFSLVDLLKGDYHVNDLQGPVAVVTAIDGITKDYGFDPIFFLEVATMLTINIGILNLLPFPALDGGRFVFLLIEAIRRKPISVKIEAAVNFVGFAALLLLMIYITAKDILGIFA